MGGPKKDDGDTAANQAPDETVERDNSDLDAYAAGIETFDGVAVEMLAMRDAHLAMAEFLKIHGPQLMSRIALKASAYVDAVELIPSVQALRIAHGTQKPEVKENHG